MDTYPQFWEWKWDIYQMAKDQVTEAGLKEPFVCALKRAGTMTLFLHPQSLNSTTPTTILLKVQSPCHIRDPSMLVTTYLI